MATALSTHVTRSSSRVQGSAAAPAASTSGVTPAIPEDVALVAETMPEKKIGFPKSVSSIQYLVLFVSDMFFP